MARRATARATPRRTCTRRPRNFTTGKFKVRTTPNGALPTHQDLVNIIRRGMPYTSMPAWPDLTDQEVANLAYYITTFSPDFTNPERAPKPVELPSAPAATSTTIEQGKKLYEETGCAKCHGTVGRGDGASAPTLKDDWDHPIRTADLTQSWTFRGGSTREDIFRTMSTGFNGTPMPAFVDGLSAEQRWAITDYIVSLSGSDGPGYTNLVVARYVKEPIDIAKGAASFRRCACGPPADRRADHGARPRVPSARDVAERAGDLRRHVDCDARAVARQDRGEDGPERAVASRASRRGRRGRQPRPRRPAASPFGDAEVAPGDAQPAEKDPFAEAEAPATTSEFSDAVAIQIPSETPAAARKPYFIFGDGENSVDLVVLRFWPRRPRVQFTGKGSADVAPKDPTDVTGVASYDQGEWSVIFKRPLRPASAAPFTPGEFLPIAFSVWDGFSRERGSRRGLTLWYSVYVEPQNVPSAIGPMIRTALIILVIELAIVGWVRWRYGSRARGGLGQPSQPAATATEA